LILLLQHSGMNFTAHIKAQPAWPPQRILRNAVPSFKQIIEAINIPGYWGQRLWSDDVIVPLRSSPESEGYTLYGKHLIRLYAIDFREYIYVQTVEGLGNEYDSGWHSRSHEFFQCWWSAKVIDVWLYGEMHQITSLVLRDRRENRQGINCELSFTWYLLNHLDELKPNRKESLSSKKNRFNYPINLQPLLLMCLLKLV